MLQHTIEYLGKTHNSKSGFELLTDEEYEKIKSDWYALPDKKIVEQEMYKFYTRGNNSLHKTNKYYFRKLMDNTLRYKCKWSINQLWDCKELVSLFVSKARSNPKVFTSELLTENIDTAFRIGGGGIAAKVANFPLDVIDQILYKYNANGNWYDFSCGWGNRMLGALKNRVNYYGTDPNYLLVDKLNECAKDFKKVTNATTETKIYCQGSEHFIPELENKIGVAFSSPPYFLLEDYGVGEQSYKEGTSYQMWIDNYLRPTFQNIFKYVIDGGYFIVNIKNFDKYLLEDDTVKTALECGFELYQVDKLKQGARCTGYTSTDNEDAECNMIDVNENIYVFIKKGTTPIKCHYEQEELW